MECPIFFQSVNMNVILVDYTEYVEKMLLMIGKSIQSYNGTATCPFIIITGVSATCQY